MPLAIAIDSARGAQAIKTSKEYKGDQEQSICSASQKKEEGFPHSLPDRPPACLPACLATRCPQCDCVTNHRNSIVETQVATAMPG